MKKKTRTYVFVHFELFIDCALNIFKARYECGKYKRFHDILFGHILAGCLDLLLNVLIPCKESLTVEFDLRQNSLQNLRSALPYKNVNDLTRSVRKDRITSRVSSSVKAGSRPSSSFFFR